MSSWHQCKSNQAPFCPNQNTFDFNTTNTFWCRTEVNLLHFYMQTTKLSKLKHSPSTELMSFTSRYFLCIQNSTDILLKCQPQTDSFNLIKIRKIHIYNFIKAHNLFKRNFWTPINLYHQTQLFAKLLFQQRLWILQLSLPFQ